MKIVKNTTLSDIDLKDIGITIPASDQYIIQPQEYLIWVDFILTAEAGTADIDLDTLINNGDLVVNNGVVDLDPAPGIFYLKYPDIANNLYVNNPNYVSDNLDDVLDEIADSIENDDDEFSYYEIPTDTEVHIKNYKQMNVHGGRLKISGQLKLTGQLRIKQ